MVARKGVLGVRKPPMRGAAGAEQYYQINLVTLLKSIIGSKNGHYFRHVRG